jgi:DNA-binding XRE family transcriptional regulator
MEYDDNWFEAVEKRRFEKRLEEFGKNPELETRKAAGRAVKAFREKHGYTQKELAGHAGLPQYTISEIETGRRNSGIDQYIRIADVFGTSLSELFKGFL